MPLYKRFFYSIIGKKYDELTKQRSLSTIGYLAILELLFTVGISTIIAKNFQSFSFSEVYNYVYSFLVDFFYNSVSLTFDTILVISVLLWLVFLITKNRVKYSKMFNLVAYASTTSMMIKYIYFIYKYLTSGQFVSEMNLFNAIYIAIVVIYVLGNMLFVSK